MAEYNPSKIIKDGNTYNFRDTTKIPLAGSNQISGDLIPSTDNSIDIGSSTKNIKMLYTKGITINGAQFVPMGSVLAAANTTAIGVGYGWGSGGMIYLYNSNSSERTGGITIQPYLVTTPSDLFNTMLILPNGTWTWSGQPIQYVSDKRLKQQISEIDDKLLDAWEDVELSQFKYNDAVDTKKDKARLHTGYVVQQIDKACKEHGVDISEYGLYCHEEYAEETREVEHDDGTKTTEVVRPANEHYSLRYTEALIVECAYLRKKNKELQEQLDKLSARLDKLESASSK